MDVTEYAGLTFGEKLPKVSTLAIESWHKTAAASLKEERALALIEMAITAVIERYGPDAKIVVSCSFGIDSIVTLHLVKTVADRLGVHFDTVWNNTLNEYPQTRAYYKKMDELWALGTIQALPNTTLRQIYEKHGVDSLFKRKGDRTHGEPVVEKCCGELKHKPMYKAIKDHGWHLMFNGVRAGESRQRWMSSRRDADYYHSVKWKTWICRPILWWTALSDTFNYGNNRQEDVWEYQRKHDIPYNPIYDMNAVIDDKYAGTRTIVDRLEAEALVADGYNVFMPRTGCQACPIPIKRGYLRYLREVFPKTYRSMLFQMGFAKALIAEMSEADRTELLDEMSGFGIITERTEEAILDRLEEIIELKPCVFDAVGVKKQPKKAKVTG